MSASDPKSWFGPLPGHPEARVVSWIVLGAALIGSVFSLVRGFQGQTFLGRPLGGDFVQFYTVGRILNQYPPERIYDLDLEVRLQHEFAAGTDRDQILVFGSAPYVGLVFRPFARLSYAPAYLAWLAFSLVLYSAGVLLLLGAAPYPAPLKTTGFLLAVSFTPFLIESWIGGQISVLAFFAMAAFVFCRSRRRRFVAGLALALALFKPTLIAIPILMLLCGRRWRMLAGVVVGAAALALTSIAMVGIKGCEAWLEALRLYGRLATGPAAALRRTKYVDIGSFVQLLCGTGPLTRVLAVVGAIAGVAMLAIAWMRSASWNAPSRDLLWAATLAAALVCNVYTPIYDTILVVPAVALAAGVTLTRSADREALGGRLVLIYVVPWVTQLLAEFLRFQPLTLVLGGFAWWALSVARRDAGGEAYVNGHRAHE